MPLRRLTATLSLALLGHLLVAQSVLACGAAHLGDARNAGGTFVHCHEGAAAGMPSLTAPASQHSPDAVPCCAVALSCGASAFDAAAQRPNLPVVSHAAVPVSAALDFSGRSIGPEPPPPK